MRVILKNIFFIGLIATLFTACEEDFDLVTEYKDQTVVYAFLEHKDPWSQTGMDTNWVVVNKAFLGEEKVSDMASVSDSVNYSDYNDFSVTLQRIKTIDPKSGPVNDGTWNHDPIVLHYTTHYKDTGAFATDNNVVFYTTQELMKWMEHPRPDEDDGYFYKLSIKKDGKDEVYATTKMLRGIGDQDGILSRPPERREINMASPFPNYTFKVELKSNLDARIYKFKIRTFYYEKRTDGKVYLDYLDYEHPIATTKEKAPSSPESMLISVAPSAWYSSFNSKLHNTDGVVWRAVKINSVGSFTETHALMFTIGSQETYVYNQVTMPSNGIVQEKPSYSNITNGVGLFTSKWNYYQNQYKLTAVTGTNYTLDSIANGVITKNLKFLNEAETGDSTSILHASDITKRY